jgi:hypothetical protein
MSAQFNIDKDRYDTMIGEKVSDYIDKVETIKSDIKNLEERIKGNLAHTTRDAYLEAALDTLKEDKLKTEKRLANAKKTLKVWQDRRANGVVGEFDLSEELTERKHKRKVNAAKAYEEEAAHNELLFTPDFSKAEKITGKYRKAVKTAIKKLILPIEALTQCENTAAGRYQVGKVAFRFVALKKGKGKDQKVVGYQVETL